jgi:hypothetical protein
MDTRSSGARAVRWISACSLTAAAGVLVLAPSEGRRATAIDDTAKPSSATASASATSASSQPAPNATRAIDFARDVQPIFENRCYECHGAAKQKAGLRLDVRENALHSLRTVDVPFVVAGESSKSLLYQRVTSTDPDERMPAKGEPLGAEQIAIVRAWIDQGANWPEETRDRKLVDHWSFKRIERPKLPDVERAEWIRNPIDRFILARLEQEKLAPSPEADRAALIRRLSFDLTGLPPTIGEIDAFLADKSPDAYEKVVDRVLASPAYGERMAVDWLDLARYADTNGYHIDNHRDMWKWREWVIDAFNQNKRYDRFTIEQLAGDLIPNATQDQKLATGFNRNGPINFEGGADPDEYQTKYVIDRVNTTSTVWMGLTMACAECHDHKYDPITQKEFYSFYAFFNNVAEKGLDGEKQNPVPSLKLPSAEEAQALAREDAAIAERERALAEPDPAFDAEQSAWEKETLAKLAPPPVWNDVAPQAFTSSGGTTLTRLDDGSILASGANPATDVYEITARASESRRITALRLEALVHDSLPHKGAGRAENANFVLSGFEMEIASDANRANDTIRAHDTSRVGDTSRTADASGAGDSSRASDARPTSDAHQASDADATQATDTTRAHDASHAHDARSGSSSSTETPSTHKVKFASATADYEQTEGGFLVVKAIDDDPASGWAVAGYQKRENREAIFVPSTPIDVGAGDVLRIRLRFESPYRQHGIGRFRISTTSDDQFDRKSTAIAMSSWWSVGPFGAGGGSAAFVTAFPPETEIAHAIDTSKTYLGGALAWREHTDWEDGKLHKLEGENCATYLYRTFTLDEARPLLLMLGSDDAVAAWLDGERVHSNDVQRGAQVDQDRVRVEAKAGENRLLVKVVNYTGNYEFSFSSSTRIEDELPRSVAIALRAPESQRTDAQKKEMREHFRRMVSTRGKALLAELETHKKARVEIDARVPQSMVMQERVEKRMTNVLMRGNFQRKGDAVSPDVPAFLPPLVADAPPADVRATNEKSVMIERPTTSASPVDASLATSASRPVNTSNPVKASLPVNASVPAADVVVPAQRSDVPSTSATMTKPSAAVANDRLALARWLVSREHPLTTRVTVNHYWQMIFGTGIVKTSEDFGARGERPSHPELLDWLAVEFFESGWSVKQLLKLIVMSSTYRQSSRVTSELEEKDPENRLLARGARQRLSAEMIHDNALALGGLLVSKIGGPSVHPYQPDGLWDAVSFSKDFSSQYYVQDHGDALYRRAMYTYWKRALPYPSLATFDAPIRETCTARRPVTETPLQALVLLNDPTYVEAARHLALRIIKEGGRDDDARLAWGFRLCTSREPTARELDVLRRALAEQSAAYTNDRAAAEKLTSVGESKNPTDVDGIVLATWTSIGSLLLNLDATVHRG